MTKQCNVDCLHDFSIDGDTIKTCRIDFRVGLKIFSRLHEGVEIADIRYFIFLQSPNFFQSNFVFLR